MIIAILEMLMMRQRERQGAAMLVNVKMQYCRGVEDVVWKTTLQFISFIGSIDFLLLPRNILFSCVRLIFIGCFSVTSCGCNSDWRTLVCPIIFFSLALPWDTLTRQCLLRHGIIQSIPCLLGTLLPLLCYTYILNIIQSIPCLLGISVFNGLIVFVTVNLCVLIVL